MEWPKAVFWNRCSFVIYMDKLNSIAKKNSSNKFTSRSERNQVNSVWKTYFY